MKKIIITGGGTAGHAWPVIQIGNILKTNIGANKSVDLLFLNGIQQIMARYPNFDSSKVYLDGYASDAISPARAARWANCSTGYIRALHSSMWGGNDYKITGKDDSNNVKYTWVGDNNRVVHTVERRCEHNQPVPFSCELIIGCLQLHLGIFQIRYVRAEYGNRLQ